MIKLRVSQKITSPIMGSPNSTEVQSILKFVPVNRGVLKTLEGAVGCPKISKDKLSDAKLTSTRRSRFELKRSKRGSHVPISTETSDAGMSKPAFDASLW